MSEKHTCECGRDFKSERALKIHKASCSFKAPEELEEEAQQPAQEEAPGLTSGKLENMMAGHAYITKLALDKQEKVSFHIPLVDGEQEGAYETVQINGYTIQIKKGVLVKLPQQVAEMLANKHQVQMDAGREMLINRKDDVAEALR